MKRHHIDAKKIYIFTSDKYTIEIAPKTTLSQNAIIVSTVNNKNIDFTISSTPDWITINKVYNNTNNNYTLTITAKTKNNTGIVRTGSIVLTQKDSLNTITITIKQEAIPGVLTSNLMNKTFPVSKAPATGFDIVDNEIVITSTIDDDPTPIQIASKPSWIDSITPGTMNSSGESILTIKVKRNRNSDIALVGTMKITQTGSAKELNINLNQLGRLTEGTPTEYPYVDKDTILDKEYPVAQLGEQIWMQEDLKSGGHAINQTKVDNWKVSYPDKYIPTIEEYYSVYGSGYTKENKLDIETLLKTEANNIDNGTYHMLPTLEDIKEMLGFFITKGGGKDWSTFGNSCLGHSLVKNGLDITIDGYDDVRQTYPQTWLDALKNGVLSNTEVKTGLDKYAFGLVTPGILHAFDNLTNVNMPYGLIQLHTRNSDPESTNSIFIYGYSLSTNINNRGIYVKDEDSAYFARPIRTLRYRSLPYDIYSDGTEIKKIKNGDTIPSGFTIVPRGGLRGAWFGNPDLSYTALESIAGWIEPFIKNYSNQLG